MEIKHAGANALTMLITLIKSALASKVDKVEGKGLSTNDYTNQDKADGAANTAARHTHGNQSVLEGITAERVALWEQDNGVLGLLVNGEELPLDSGGKASITVPRSVSELTNDAGYQTARQVEQQISGAVSSVYRPGGSLSFAGLPAAGEQTLGMVYNITDSFVTTDGFLEGPGISYPTGTNVTVVEADGGYRYDVLAGFVDLSGYLQSQDVQELSNEEINQLWSAISG